MKRIKYLLIRNSYEIFNTTTESFFKRDFLSRFDIFFLDPPFSNEKFLQDIKLIKKYKLFKKNHLIIIHRERESKDKFQNILDIIFTKTYGRSKIIFATLLE